jgi:hypothetical protein
MKKGVKGRGVDSKKKQSQSFNVAVAKFPGIPLKRKDRIISCFDSFKSSVEHDNGQQNLKDFPRSFFLTHDGRPFSTSLSTQ